ncbi:glycosyl hydrolase family 18 protein [Chitiniphilus purpureus]|uniref:chitinase n=1 Tax=Chitiniphilus purpureus TaxID=2981137 RepID=A0ABY6DS42_9NEIS|nr:glycosyl hydrolase family 18 protein [Chitiniphilus sp. CD1]UXY16847.1 glycosyl hydrolase family 18 protein [Chitiniphilus sp. CD1]
MRARDCWHLIILVLLTGLTGTPLLADEPVVAGYFASWATYHRPAPFERIAFERLTHLIYAHAIPQADGTVQPGDFVADFSHAYPPSGHLPGARGTYARLRQVRALYPRLRTLISIGGWNDSTHFPQLAANPSLRRSFARNLVAFMSQHGFDGAVIDWRYPATGGASWLRSTPADSANLVALLATLRAAAVAARPERPYLLVLTLGGKPAQITPLDLHALARQTDFLLLLAYDYAGPWRRTTGHGAPLHAAAGGVADAMAVLERRGIPGRKLVLGITNQGNAWTGVPAQNNGLAQLAGGALPGSWDDERSGPSGVLDHDEVLALKSDARFVEHWDEWANASSLYNPERKLFVTYESPRSLSAKLSLADAHGYRGVALWELSGDSVGRHSLLRQIHLHYAPVAGRWQNLREAWGARPGWIDLLAASLATAALLLLAARGWWLHLLERHQLQAAGQLRAIVTALLPALQAARQSTLTERIAADDSPQWAPLQQSLSRLQAHATVLAPAATVAAPASDAAPQPDADPPTGVTRLDELNAMLARLGEQNTAERMLEVVMAFLARQPRVAGVALLQDGTSLQADGEMVQGAPGVVHAGVHWRADRRQAWLNADDGSDFQLALVFHEPADAEDEALLHHLAQQIALVRRHLTALTRHPHVLAELYEIASRRDRLLFIRADKGYSGLHTADGGLPLHITLRLRVIRRYFGDDTLLQVHRSYLVNPRKVTRAEHVGKGQYELLLGTQRVPVSRPALARLRAVHPHWFMLP